MAAYDADLHYDDFYKLFGNLLTSSGIPSELIPALYKKLSNEVLVIFYYLFHLLFKKLFQFSLYNLKNFHYLMIYFKVLKSLSPTY